LAEEAQRSALTNLTLKILLDNATFRVRPIKVNAQRSNLASPVSGRRLRLTGVGRLGIVLPCISENSGKVIRRMGQFTEWTPPEVKLICRL
jgi:hypothetical protein